MPYCNKVKAEPLETQCTDDHSSVALCNLVKYPEPLPRQYQVRLYHMLTILIVRLSVDGPLPKLNYGGFKMIFQNFEYLPNIPSENMSFYGGSVTLADYCPYVQEFTWRANSVVIRGSHCYYEENNPGKKFLSHLL